MTVGSGDSGGTGELAGGGAETYRTSHIHGICRSQKFRLDGDLSYALSGPPAILPLWGGKCLVSIYYIRQLYYLMLGKMWKVQALDYFSTR
ncbi:hypothetical protein CFP56_028151 [Quercus suber]|uniref:Uncharacterized protein n=1 Tax=Quercus suber TaxID=58331 RepID=A0AAW0JW14_QUESU